MEKIFWVMLFCIFCAIPTYAENMANSQETAAARVKVDLTEYAAKVQDKIQKTWMPPDVVEQGHTVVIFKLDRSGKVVSSYIKEGSGNSLYDLSTLEAIEKAAPFVTIPEDYDRDCVTMQYSFDSSIVSRDSIKELVEKAERYTGRDNNQAISYINQAIKAIEGDPASYFLYARRYKLNKLLGNNESADNDLAESRRLKALYNAQRIAKCKRALSEEETPFAYFTLANAYELAGDYDNAIKNIDIAIGMTDLNHAYKRYRAEIIMKSK